MTKCRAAVGGSRPIFGFQILFVYIHSLWQYSRSLVGYGIAWASRSTAGFGRRPRPPETTVVKESEWFCGFSFYPIPAIDGVFACCIEWTVLLFVFIRLPIHVDWNSSSWLVFQPVTTKDLPDKKRVLKSFFFFIHKLYYLYISIRREADVPFFSNSSSNFKIYTWL